MRRTFWWLLFALASYALSLFFQTFKAFTLTPDLTNGLYFAGAIAFLVATVMVLLYDSYAREKAKGNVMNKIGLFEWFYKKGICQ